MSLLVDLHVNEIHVIQIHVISQVFIYSLSAGILIATSLGTRLTFHHF